MGAPRGVGRASLPRGFLEASLTSTPSLLDHVRLENHDPEGFIPFGLRLILCFFEILKKVKKQQFWAGPPVNRLVPKIIEKWIIIMGNVAEIQNFPTYHQDLSMERPATSRKESASTYPCRSLSGSVQVNGVDGVVLVVIQITDDPSAERTAPPRSTHVQLDDVSHALIQQGERERLRKTPSSSSTTAWW